jgi:site-specific DNA-methyltransferase (adenine-specific)
VLGQGSLLAYLISMTLRIAEIYRVLKPTGSFYFHCDPTASHYLKIVIDSIFCSQTGEYQNEIIWKRTSGHSDAEGYGSTHDVIFYYTKSDKYTWNQQYQKYDAGYVEQYYRYSDTDGRKWMSGDLSAAGLSGGGYEYEWKGVKRVWRCPIETMQKLDGEGKIFYTKNGIPRMKRYIDEAKGMPAQDLWTDVEAIRSWHREKMGYPTQKPEGLLERIINSSSNIGDVVLDAYCGCGTTISVAERLNRNWIGIDITYQRISLILKRMEDTFGKRSLDSVKIAGVPEDFESAEALAHKQDDRTRKEFEKWAVLTYSDNRAIINEKKGGDGGIDGIAFMIDRENNDNVLKQVIFSVKSDKKPLVSYIRDLNGTIEREKAAMGYLLTLYPADNLVKESMKYGVYKNKLLDKDFPKIQVVSIQELLKNEKMPIPATHEIAVVKAAEAKGKNIQHKLDL